MSVKAIDVTIEINASIDNVFERLSDHGNYSSFPGVSSAKLISVGKDEKNGMGAVRKVTLKGFGFLPFTFVEAIPMYQKPHVFEYLLESARYDFGFLTIDMGVNHHFGRLTFSEKGGKTTVNWVSKFEITWLLVRYPLALILKLEGSRLFMNILKFVKKEAEASKKTPHPLEH